MTESKLQIRARLLSAIMELQSPANKNTQAATAIIASLSDIEDKNTILEILIKEFKKEISEDKVNILFCIMHELLKKNEVEEALLKELANPSLSDNIKSNIINILRGFGNHLNYDDYLQFLQNPQEIIDADTTRLLSNAIVNPESQIDFLDFINALPHKEGMMLLDSLNSDYDGDNLANILTPLILSKPYSELAFIAIRDIGSSKSELALNTLTYVIENIDDLKIQAQAQKSINMLKLSGIKEDNTKEFYKNILAESPVYKCFVNLPDGHGNIGIIFSRKNNFGLIQMFATVVNDVDGIVDSFGFNEISEQEFVRISSKFYANDDIIEVKPEFCKYLLNEAEKLSRLMYKEMSYEYAAWRTIINDVEVATIDFEENAKNLGFNEFLLKQIYKTNYFDKWFFDEKSDLGSFLTGLTEINDPKVLFEKELPFEEIFTPQLVKTINHRLLIMSYLLRVSGNNVNADIVYSLINDENCKRRFFEDMIKKSIYEYLLNIKEQYHNCKHAPSIFTRKKEEERKKIDIKFVEKMLERIEENWIDND